MKKIIISIFCFIVCLAMVGCSSNSDSQALKNLNSQLNRVSEIVSSTSSSEVSEVSPSFSQPYTNNNYQLPRLKENAYQNMLKEEELRQNVLTLNVYLKETQGKKYKLGKNKANALNDLTSNLSKYATYLNDTKANVKNSVNKIKKSTKIQSLDIEQAKAGYVELGNNMNERLSYLSNLYNTLNEIAILLDNNCIEENNNINTNNLNNYYNYDKNNNEYNNQNNQIETNNNKKSNIDTFNNNLTNNNINSTNNLNNNQNNFQNQYQDYGYNNYNNYDFNYWYGRNNKFNPNRNTDTFFPRYRNIDTFKFTPNKNGHFHNQIIDNNINNNQTSILTTNNAKKTNEKNISYINSNDKEKIENKNKEKFKIKLDDNIKNKEKNQQKESNVIVIHDKNIKEMPNKNVHDLKNLIDNFLDSKTKTKQFENKNSSYSNNNSKEIKSKI